MKKVLIITYYWPPASGPGVQRWLKFVKYLPLYGWQPIILTVEGGSYPGYDHGLLNEIPKNIKVYRTKTREPFRVYNILRGKKGNSIEVGGGAFNADSSIMRRIGTYIRSNFFIPDARVGWNKYAIKKADVLIKEHNIKYIVTTSPPHSSQLIGLALIQKHNLQWLADLRDPWMSMMYNQFLTRTERSIKKDQDYENQVLEKADQVTVVGRSMKLEFEDRAENIHVITNGYDESDINTSDQNPEQFKKFTLFFMGSFLSQQSIQNLWKSIQSLKENHESIENNFQFLIIGNVSEIVLQAIKDFNLSSLVNIEPFQPHKQVIENLKKSHLLFLPIPETEGNKMIITGKIFEYLASKLPILAIGPQNGDADYILQQTERDPILEYNSYKLISDRIKNAFLFWAKHKNQVRHKNDLHLQFERKILTKKMANVLDLL